MTRYIELDGREYALRFTVNALCNLEARFGSLNEALKTEFTCLRALIWCGLMEEEHLTLEAAGALLQRHFEHGGTLESTAEAVADALNDACFFHLPEADEAPAVPSGGDM